MMKYPGKEINRLAEIASKAESLSLIFFLCMIVLIVFAGVIVRYTPISGLTIWTAELARLFLLWMVFWSAGAVERHSGHYRIDLIDSVLSSNALLFLQLLFRLILLVAMGILIWWTIVYFGVVSNTRTLLLEWPEVIRAIPLLFGSVLLVTHCLIGFVQNLLRWFRK